ncbi:uncharacterized protein LOC143283231 [Babylonia areolata]|uniref:uncharacterized protein LOC143283231 n=1 Tax=Babylonia areolata TaxID=304850 RepID=UPI003FD09E8B
MFGGKIMTAIDRCPVAQWPRVRIGNARLQKSLSSPRRTASPSVASKSLSQSPCIMQFCGRCPILLECSAVIVFLLSCFGGSAGTSGYANDRLTATCYRLVTSPVLNWTNARDACFNNNETLVVLEPVEKASFILDFVITNYAPHGYTRNIAIGASRPEADWGTDSTSFQWINGQPLDLNATEAFITRTDNWKRLDSDVMTIKRGSEFLWGSADASNDRPYICERPFM